MDTRRGKKMIGDVLPVRWELFSAPQRSRRSKL